MSIDLFANTWKRTIDQLNRQWADLRDVFNADQSKMIDVATDTSHIRNWKWASAATPVLRALSVMTSSKKRDQGFALDPRAVRATSPGAGLGCSRAFCGRRAWGTRHPSRARAHECGHGLSLLPCGHLRLVHEPRWRGPPAPPSGGIAVLSAVNMPTCRLGRPQCGEPIIL